MSHFCLLRDPDHYVPSDWDLLRDEPERSYWLEHFRKQFEDTLTHAAEQYGKSARGQIDDARREFGEALRRLGEQPGSLPGGRLDLVELDRLRDGVLRDNGLLDPYAGYKQRQNASARTAYPEVVREFHALDGESKWLHLLKGVFAGNTFDVGTPETARTDNPGDFFTAVEQTKDRPWAVDDFEALASDLLSAPPTKWAKAVFFVDNAGMDFILGVMPLARELALWGTQVVLAANAKPTLNDVTADEAVELVEQLATEDPELAAMIQAGLFEVASSGSEIPLLDLSEVSDELNEAAADADLVVLEGMGRALESNAQARFTVDCLRLALLKNPRVAQRVGGELFDCVCQYTPVGD